MEEKRHFQKAGYAIWLSALVYPGSGQFLQKRWIAGSLIVLGFSLAIGWAALVVFHVMRVYYSLAFNFNDATPTEPVSISRLTGALLACFLIYVVNLIDVALAVRRQGRKMKTEV